MLRAAVIAAALAALTVPVAAPAADAHDRDRGRRWAEQSCWAGQRHGHHRRHHRPTPSTPSTPSTPTVEPSAPPETLPPATAPLPSDRVNAPFTDPAGTTSTYHLYTSSTRGPARGIVVYLDGDGMYGHRNPTTTWALGGDRGIIAQAGQRGYATLSVMTPSRDRTFWTAGARNAAYVAALAETIRNETGAQKTWIVAYSGGSQLVTKHLIPAHSGTFTTGGGAVITGGGGRPSGTPNINPALKAGFPMHWYTGTDDDGRNTSDGYDSIRDARAGHAWYLDHGYAATLETPAGVDHNDLGGRFGTVLAEQIDRHS